MEIDIKKLKEFTLSQLRKDNSKLLSILKNAEFSYIQYPHYASYPSKVIIKFSDSSDFDLIKAEQYKNNEYLKNILGYALNSHHDFRSGYYLGVEFLFDLNNRNDLDISNANEDLSIFNQLKNKILERYEEYDDEGALTACKSMLESIYKKILDDNSVKYEKKDDFIDLSTKAFNTLKLNTEKGLSTIENKIKKSIITINNAINEGRNLEGDGHGQNPEKKNIIDHTLIKFIIEITISLASYIEKKHH